MELDFDSMTWTCMICRKERPDAKVSVAHRPLEGREGQFPDTRVNVRYCNDDQDCIDQATAEGVWPPKEGS